MPNLRSTLLYLNVDVAEAVKTVDAVQDVDIRESIEHAQPFFGFVQTRIEALGSVCTEKVKRNKSGWTCDGTIAMLEHVATRFEEMVTDPTHGNEAKALQAQALALRTQTQALDAKIKAQG